MRLLDETWSASTEGRVRGSPVLGDRTVYVGSTDGRVYAVDRDTGEVRWTFHTGSSTVHRPVIHENTILTAAGAALYAIDRASGTAVWEVRDRHFMHAPVVDDDLLFAYAADRQGWRLYALDFTGETRWMVDRTVAEAELLQSNLAVTDGAVFVASWNGILAFDRQNGHVRWTVDWPQCIESIVSDGRSLYAGARTIDSSANVLAIDPARGSITWTQRIQAGEWITAVSLHDGVLYTSGIEPTSGGTKTRRVAALSVPDGEVMWSVITNARSASSVPPRMVSVSDGHDVATGDAGVSILDAIDGTIQQRLRPETSVHTRPAVSAGEVIVGSDDGHIYAFEGNPEAGQSESITRGR